MTKDFKPDYDLKVGTLTIGQLNFHLSDYVKEKMTELFEKETLLNDTRLTLKNYVKSEIEKVIKANLVDDLVQEAVDYQVKTQITRIIEQTLTENIRLTHRKFSNELKYAVILAKSVDEEIRENLKHSPLDDVSEGDIRERILDTLDIIGENLLKLELKKHEQNRES